MRPTGHHRLIAIAFVAAIVLLGPLGFFAGGFVTGGKPWGTLTGMVVAPFLGVLITRFVLCRYVAVHCPGCRSRMRAKPSRGEDVVSYFCPVCGDQIFPTLESQRAFVGWLLSQANSSPASPPLKLQFGLRSVMMLTVAAAILSWMLFVLPPGLSGGLIVILALALPLALAVGIPLGRGYLRVFCVGGLVPALFPALPLLLWAAWQLAVTPQADTFHDRLTCALFLCFDLGAILSTGILAVAVWYGVCSVLRDKKQDASVVESKAEISTDAVCALQAAQTEEADENSCR